VTTPPMSHLQRHHISIVSETFPPEINGVANTLKHLCQGLKQRGRQITVVRPAQPGEPKGPRPHQANSLCSGELVVTGVPIPGYSELQFGLARSAQLVAFWKQCRPESIYVATQGPLGLAAVKAAKRLGIPVCSGFHTNFHSYSGYYGLGALEWLLRGYGRWFHNRTRQTLVPTRKMQTTVERMGIHNARLWSRGVDCQTFTPHKRCSLLRQSWGLSDSDRAVVYVGRLAAEKNVKLAVSCFERIRCLHPTARFILVGDGPLRQQLEARHPDYIFCGSQRGDDLARHYASADLFLFPSKTDTFGNVVLEAMASGLGVVAFDDAAAAEHIRQNENGMKAPLSDDEAFITHALRLMDQPSQLNQIRTRARLDALDLTWTSQIEIFEQLVLKPSERGPYNATDKQSIPIL